MTRIEEARIQAGRTLRDPVRRIALYAILAALLLILSVWPRPYVARAKLLPQENGSAAGLGSMIDVLGGKLNDYSALLGQRNSIETYLLVARSTEVSADVIARLKLAGPDRRYGSVEQAEAALENKVDIHALLGGVMEIEAHAHDGAEAQALTAAYLAAINDRIGALSRTQVTAKRVLVENRFQDASERVTKASDAFNAFRQRYHLADPEAQFGAALSQRTQLEGMLKAKQVQLQTLQRFSGEDNPELKALQTEIGALQDQLAGTIRSQSTSAGPNLAALTQLQNQYLNLYRDYRFAQGLYDSYSRFIEQVDLQEFAAASGADIQIIEAPHLDPERHYNVSALALLGALAMLIIFIEIYVPATGFGGAPGEPPRER